MHLSITSFTVLQNHCPLPFRGEGAAPATAVSKTLHLTPLMPFPTEHLRLLLLPSCCPQCLLALRQCYLARLWPTAHMPFCKGVPQAVAGAELLSEVTTWPTPLLLTCPLMANRSCWLSHEMSLFRALLYARALDTTMSSWAPLPV